ncbi:MAG: DUF3825 domain-containing protein [Oscillospiraceae bacterium]|nr:DUF3825 domain-containing protein [Oscillospiraceae bacterium]
MTRDFKIKLYNCILRQFPDPGLYKVSRLTEWLCTNGFSLEALGYSSFRQLAEDFPEMFGFQSDNNNDFIETKKWQDGEENKTTDDANVIHPADNFFGTNNIILNDDIIEMTQQSLYALTKILDNGCTVTVMKQEIYRKFDEAKLNGKLNFFGEKYVFPIDYCPDGFLVNGVITKNLSSHGKSLYFSFEKTQIFITNPNEPTEPRNYARAHTEIPLEDKNRIYMLLTDSFPCEQPIHMASISKCLKKSGVDHNKYDFYKMKELLAALEFLKLDNVMLGGVQQTMVTIKNIPGAQAKTEDRASFPTRRVQPEASSKIPAGELTDFCSLPVKPMGILEQFLKDNGIDASYDSITRDLCGDFEKARAEGTVRAIDTKLVFSSRYQKSDGSRVEITIKPNAYEGKSWFLYYVDTVVRERSVNVSPGKQLESFAFLGNWSAFLSDLAAKAVDEEWDFRSAPVKNYHILMLYIKYTFSRLMRENKICISSDNRFAAFNTGLADSHYDDIYACFLPNDPGGETEWRYAGFCTAASGGLGKQLVDCFNPLPEPPSYFKRNEDLFYNNANQLHTDFEHIIIDNIKRLPIQFLYDQFFDNADARDIAERIKASRDRVIRGDLYERLKRIITENDRLFVRIQNRLKDAIELAQKRVRWNYKTAIPSYFPKRDTMSLMLPLALVDEAKPDVALVVELTRSGSYQGQTILTLPQAYIDARLICRLTGDWLVPSQIFSSDEFAVGEELSETE